MSTVNNNVKPIRDPESALDRLFHKMTFVPEILRRQADYDREVELFGAAWDEVQALRNQVAAEPELLEACEWMVKYGSHQWEPGSDAEPRFMDKVRNAIAKAKGIKQEQETLPSLGDEDATFAIAEEGGEFLAAIKALEEAPDSNTSYLYLGWRMFNVNASIYYASRNFGEFTLKAPSARSLVTAIYTLETNGVTEPAEDDAS